MEVHTQLLKQLKNIEKAKKAVVVDAVLEDQIPVTVDHSWHSREWVGA